MIDSEEIEKILDWLEQHFDSAEKTDIDEPRIFAKMAILELSGWVEESNDRLVLDISEKKLTDPHAKRRIEKLVKGMQGFSYQRHFKKLIDKSIGALNRERIEADMDRKDRRVLAKFRTSLTELSKSRDDLAHTFSHGTQQGMDGPTETRRHFENIRRGLQAYKDGIAMVMHCTCSPESASDAGG